MNSSCQLKKFKNRMILVTAFSLTDSSSHSVDISLHLLHTDIFRVFNSLREVKRHGRWIFLCTRRLSISENHIFSVTSTISKFSSNIVRLDWNIDFQLKMHLDSERSNILSIYIFWICEPDPFLLYLTNWICNELKWIYYR